MVCERLSLSVLLGQHFLNPSLFIRHSEIALAFKDDSRHIAAMRNDGHSSMHQHLPPGIGVIEFVAMMASMMSMVALQIDPMLPALPEIGRDLQVAHANDRQLIIVQFFVGLGCGALIFGPLSDRFGRRPVLLLAGLGTLAATISCALSTSFEVMLAGRLLGGFFAASARVMIASIVRDCFQGDHMARIMSFVILIFIVVPVVAPTVGQVILYFAPWRAIFWMLVVLVGAQLLWVALRLPETLEPERRGGIDPRIVAGSFLKIATHRNAIGHMIASGLMMAGLVGFISTVQQIFSDTFGRAELLGPGFAFIVFWMALGALVNGRLVERYGARRLSQSAVIGVVTVSLVHLAVIVFSGENIVTFILAQALVTTCFSFAGANFSAISLEPFSRSAGVASSIQTTTTTLISAGLGGLAGAMFNGTTIPLTLGFILFGSLSFLVIAWAENWRLFRRPGNARLREGF